jgi:hypothetical protein
MYFGLLLIIGGLFFMFWGLHYFGFLATIGSTTGNETTSSNTTDQSNLGGTTLA